MADNKNLDMEFEELDLDQMSEVTGGHGNNQATAVKYCPSCGTNRTFRLSSGARAFCTVCNEQIVL